MSETTKAILRGFHESADRLLRGNTIPRGESIALAITCSWVKAGIELGMIDGVSLDYVARVEQALWLLDEPKTVEKHQWN